MWSLHSGIIISNSSPEILFIVRNFHVAILLMKTRLLDDHQSYAFVKQGSNLYFRFTINSQISGSLNKALLIYSKLCVKTHNTGFLPWWFMEFYPLMKFNPFWIWICQDSYLIVYSSTCILLFSICAFMGGSIFLLHSILTLYLLLSWSKLIKLIILLILTRLSHSFSVYQLVC